MKQPGKFSCSSRRFLVIGGLQAPQTGSKIRCRGIAAALAGQGQEVWYLEPTAPGSREEVYLPGVRRIPTWFPSWPFMTGALAVLWDHVRRLARARRFDWVIAAKSLPTSCLPALFLRKSGTRAILDIDDIEYAYWERSPWVSRFLQSFERSVVRFFDVVSVHNQALRGYVTEELGFSGQVQSLPQGIDFPRYRGRRPPPAYRLPGHKVLVYAAFLGVASDVDRVLEIHQVVRRTFPDLILLVVGGGPRLAEFRRLAESSGGDVRFTGYLDHSEALDVMSRADVALNFLEDSYANRFRSPIKLREYLALGRKVVATDVGDTSLFGSVIRLVKPSVEDCARAIQAALQDDRPVDAEKVLLHHGHWPTLIQRFLEELPA